MRARQPTHTGAKHTRMVMPISSPPTKRMRPSVPPSPRSGDDGFKVTATIEDLQRAAETNGVEVFTSENIVPMRVCGHGTYGFVYAFRTPSEGLAGKMVFGIPIGKEQFGRAFDPATNDRRVAAFKVAMGAAKEKKRKAHMLADNFLEKGVNFHSLRELGVLAKLRGHANIVAVKGLMLSRLLDGCVAQAFIMMEECPMPLSDVCRSSVCMRMRVLARVFHDILSGLKCMHDAKIIHRDVKAANILVGPTFATCKLADFGASREFGGSNGKPSEFEVVTVAYRAPELILGAESYGTPIDVWAAGVTIAEVMGGYRIFGDPEKLYGLLKRMFEYLGEPTASTMQELGSFTGPESGRLRALVPPVRAVPVVKLMTATNACHGDDPMSILPLAKMCISALNMSPTDRPTVDELLAEGVFDEAEMAARNEVAVAMLSVFHMREGGGKS